MGAAFARSVGGGLFYGVTFGIYFAICDLLDKANNDINDYIRYAPYLMWGLELVRKFFSFLRRLRSFCIS